MSRSCCKASRLTAPRSIRSVAALLALALSGCALFPLSEAECRGVDWQQRGYADGYSGTHPQDIRLVSECKERYGVEVDREAYAKGWAAGHDEWDRIQGSMRRRGL